MLSRFALAAIALLLLTTACEEHVFTEGELQAQRKFKAVAPGTPEASARAALGPPVAELRWDPGRNAYAYTDANGSRTYFDPRKDAARSGLPAEFRFFPKKMLATKVLIYSSGTVFGYLAIDDANKVSSVEVHIS